MKKSYFLLALGGLLVTSCSNDDLVNPTPNGGENVQGKMMQFSVRNANQSRANAGLQSEMYEFGVWAYKATAEDGIAATGACVMDQYMVGYWNETDQVGYKPTNSQNLYGTMWYYEGLGKSTEDSKFTFKAGPVQDAAKTSVNNFQYLKYWDFTANLHTYFYAGVPYDALVSFTPASHQLKFDTMIMATNLFDTNGKTNYMYARKDIVNEDMKGGDKVDLTFYRLASQIRIGFYETIPGYDVEIIGYDENNPQVYAKAAHKEGDVYSGGKFIIGGKPTVQFNGAAAPTISWGSVTQSAAGATIACPIDYFALKSAPTAFTKKMGESVDNPLLGHYKSMLPSSTNDGFTLNVSLKLIAKDTKEVIYVRGARVHVPADKCVWAPNTRYTYLFHITRAVPGQPEEPGDPKVDPTPNPYLVPIVFEDVEIQEWLDEDPFDFPLNQE